MLTRPTVAPPSTPFTGLVPKPRSPQPIADGVYLSEAAMTALVAGLAERGITHGPLVEGDPYLNHNVSDRSRVFCKVSRPGDLSPRPHWEIAGARAAAAAGIDGSTALLEAPFEISDENGAVRLVTAWRFETGCAAPSLVDQARMVSSLAASLTRVPAPSEAHTFDLAFFADRIERRLASFVALGERESLSILARARDYFAAIADTIRPETFTWMHGDVHLKNVMWRVNGKPMLVDWESHCIGPIEWDVAAMVRSCLQDFTSHDLSTQFRAARVAVEAFAEQVDFDRELALLFVSARGASYQSHLRLVGHNPAMLKRSYEIDDMVRRGHIARLFGRP